MGSSKAMFHHGGMQRTVLMAGAACGACLAGHQVYQSVRSRRQLTSRAPGKFLLPLPVVDGLAGAIGEVAQISLLYPVETIKVRCQADSIGAIQVVRNMIAKYGVSLALLQQLYSGFSAAAGLSVVVGAVHWLSFCAAKRAAMDVLPPSQPSPAAQSSTASKQTAGAGSSLVAVDQDSTPAGTQQREVLSERPPDHHVLMPGAAMMSMSDVVALDLDHSTTTAAHSSSAHAVLPDQGIMATQGIQMEMIQDSGSEQSSQGTGAACSGTEMQQQQHAHGLGQHYDASVPAESAHLYGSVAHASSTHHTLVTGHEEVAVMEHHAHKKEEDLGNKSTANAIAAVVGAFCTAVVESPVELFRHQAQAGVISGSLFQEMSRSIRTGGPLALWQGFLPFCLEAFPYDIFELGSYSQLRDLYDTQCKPGARFHRIAKALPEHGVDLAIGATAGAAGVVVSMPFDCIKTYMQTRIPNLAALKLGPGGELKLFLSTGANMVQQKGFGALYVGITPRLIQQVPSSTICWWAVQQVQKALAPYTEGGGSSSSHH